MPVSLPASQATAPGDRTAPRSLPLGMSAMTMGQPRSLPWRTCRLDSRREGVTRRRVAHRAPSETPATASRPPRDVGVLIGTDSAPGSRPPVPDQARTSSPASNPIYLPLPNRNSRTEAASGCAGRRRRLGRRGDRDRRYKGKPESRRKRPSPASAGNYPRVIFDVGLADASDSTQSVTASPNV